MPYYSSINTLFIHIPKTGGTSVENFLRTKSRQTLHCGVPKNNLLPVRNVSLQHQFYSTLYNNRKLININFDDKLKVITIVRNPYHRLVSDLFHFKLIKPNSSPQFVFDTIKEYIKGNNYDNHNVQQYKFIYNEDGSLMNPNINIFKTETLTQDLRKYGFKKFDIRSNVGGFNRGKKKIDYMKFLNKSSIELINKHYSKDFELFGYSKLPSE